MHATEKHLEGLTGPAISKGNIKSTKTMYHLTHLAGYGEFENLCFVSIA